MIQLPNILSLSIRGQAAPSEDSDSKTPTTPANLANETTFFGLPRELRDQIYECVFGTNTIALLHDGMRVIATNSLPLVPATVQEAKNGLPRWLLSNRQMCDEALETLGRTRIFTVVGYNTPKLNPDELPEFELAQMLYLRGEPTCNPIIFKPNVIRNIAVFQWAPIAMSLADRTFLQLLSTNESLKRKDACLDLFWTQTEIALKLTEKDLDTILQRPWYAFGGACTRVRINVKYPHVSSALMLRKIAENCATSLVGGKVRMGVWEDLGAVDMGRTLYSRQCLKVEGVHKSHQ
jgi:hypothetical protein